MKILALQAAHILFSETLKKTEGHMTESEKLRKAKEATLATGRKLAGEAADKVKEIKGSPRFRSIGPLTWLGLGITLLFLFFMLVDTVNFRWWVMLPLGASGLLIFWRQRSSAREKNKFEADVCLVGLIVLAAFMVIRDAWVSYSLADIYDSLSKLDMPFNELGELLGK
jgi:amino acid transporter